MDDPGLAREEAPLSSAGWTSDRIRSRTARRAAATLTGFTIGLALLGAGCGDVVAAGPKALRPDDPEFAPTALSLDALGNLFAVDQGRSRIHRYSEDEGWSRFGIGDQGGGRFASIVALHSWGPDLYALDSAQTVLYRFGLDGRLRSRIGLAARELGATDPVDFVIDKTGELLVLDRAGARLLRFDREGRFVSDLTEGVVGAERLRSPVRLDLDGAGTLYVLDPADRRVRRFSRQGDALPSWRYDAGLGDGATRAVDLAVFPDGKVVVVARDGTWMRLFGPEGRLRRTGGIDSFAQEVGSGSDPGSGDPRDRVARPRTVAALAAGPGGTLYLAYSDVGEIGSLVLVSPATAVGADEVR